MSLQFFDIFFKKSAINSFESDVKEEQNLIEKIEEISRIVHIDCNHGCCVTIVGGSMHAFYQLIVSIEKATLVPITYPDNIFKSYVDGYGKQVVDLRLFEEDVRAVRTLDAMSNGSSNKLLLVSEALLEEYEFLILSKIGVPSYFPFTLKKMYSCFRCRKISKPILFSQHILKLETICSVKSISLSELIR
jgi:hypothetical protein